ncbi:hypothetical protein [Azospirillum soli]|uniref:hypothetical protein n=1 Tax=Azospirillum soli TaxID=1304799 RepID=UPI001AE47FE1|nr:hypothetical protein [Azospirillum soli]MBP2315487.1 hypothetical protein [Azospirillum soli]
MLKLTSETHDEHSMFAASRHAGRSKDQHRWLRQAALALGAVMLVAVDVRAALIDDLMSCSNVGNPSARRACFEALISASSQPKDRDTRPSPSSIAKRPEAIVVDRERFARCLALPAEDYIIEVMIAIRRDGSLDSAFVSETYRSKYLSDGDGPFRKFVDSVVRAIRRGSECGVDVARQKTTTERDLLGASNIILVAVDSKDLR